MSVRALGFRIEGAYVGPEDIGQYLADGVRPFQYEAAPPPRQEGVNRAGFEIALTDIFNVEHRLTTTVQRFINTSLPFGHGYTTRVQFALQNYGRGVQYVSVPFFVMRGPQQNWIAHLRALMRKLEQYGPAEIGDENAPMRFHINYVLTPRANGRRPSRENVEFWLKAKRSVIRIPDSPDKNCGAKAVSVAVWRQLIQGRQLSEKCLSYLMESVLPQLHIRWPRSVTPQQYWQAIRKGGATQDYIANILMGATGIAEGGDLEEIVAYEEFLDTGIIIYDLKASLSVAYKPTKKYQHEIYLLRDGPHYNVITSPRGLFEHAYECKACGKFYDQKRGHVNCADRCKLCKSKTCGSAAVWKSSAVIAWVQCADCNRSYPTPACFEAHRQPYNPAGKSSCESWKKCGIQGCPGFKPWMYSDWKSEHHCTDKQCSNCGKVRSASHSCSLKTTALRRPNDKLIFFDFEAEQSTGIHNVTHVVAQYTDGMTFSWEPDATGNFTPVIDNFCEWLFAARKHAHYTAIAHNGCGYDFHFILAWAIARGLTVKQCIRAGQKIKYLVVGNIRFVDSLSFFLMPLSAFSKTFGVPEVRKGFFPHMFNTPTTQNYIGAWPDATYYTPACMPVKKRNEFYDWYVQQSDKIFDFRQEIMSYCVSDVELLRKGCMVFRDQFMQEHALDPFQYVTIASACLALWRQKFMPPDSVAILKPEQTEFIRKSFAGGRTCVMQAYAKTEPGQKIRYLDVTSLYPWVNARCLYPKGPPQEIPLGYVERTPDECAALVNALFGFVDCYIVPPKGLLHPVLAHKHEGRLVFDLLPKRGVWCTVELHTAIAKGYTIMEVYHALHWPHAQRTTELFGNYVNTFLKSKQEASGWAGKKFDGKQVETEAEKVAWIDTYKTREGITIDGDAVEHNPGRRALSKLCLNSLWGKLAQRNNPSQTTYAESSADINSVFSKYKVKDIFSVGIHPRTQRPIEEIVYCEWGICNSIQNTTNMAVAAFTTSHARNRLYDALDTVGDAAIYCDTDSVVFYENDDTTLIETGDLLGEWTDECGPGEHITEFVALGPKMYAYRSNTGREYVKAKGIRPHYSATNSVLNLENYKRALFDYAAETNPDVEIETDGKPTVDSVVEPTRITRDKRTKQLLTIHNFTKMFRATLHNKGDFCTRSFRLYPFGYGTGLELLAFAAGV